VLRRVTNSFSPDRAPREQFHRFWQVIGQFVLDHPKAFAFLELHHHSPYLDETSRGYSERLTQMASVLLRDLQAKQIIKPLPVDLLMAVIWGALVGVVRAGWEGRLDLSLHTFEMAERCSWESVRT
jgi:TetR/AcrR family transcriptional regulator, repressor of fatR-cypB operon